MPSTRRMMDCFMARELMMESNSVLAELSAKSKDMTLYRICSRGTLAFWSQALCPPNVP